MDINERLAALNISLPQVSPPAGAYLPYVQTGKLLFISGHLARRNGAIWGGKLGDEVSVAEGAEAARSIAIDLLGTLQHATGDLNRIKRIVKVLSLVNSTPDFTEQHIVTNGASNLLVEVFGDKGAHARSAFGVAQIPFGACVEIELVVELA